MPSVRATFLAVASAFAATARADYYVEPSSVSLSTRQSWCASETSTCPLICQDMGASGATVNTCNATTLTYGCLCNDNTTPNVSEYTLTLPYFVCEEWGNQCVTACGSNNTCSGACRTDHPCGASDPAKNKNNASTTATTATASATGADTVYTGGLGGQSSASGPGSVEMIRVWATIGTVAMFSLGFGYVL